MAQESEDGIESLTAVLPQLNTAMAEATAMVHAIDLFLTEELAVGPWVASRPFDSQRALGDDGRELLVTSHLACGRVGGKYRLHILNATLGRTEGKEPFAQIVGEERTAWLSCTREVRLQSFAMLPELLNLLAVKVSEIATQTIKTVETVREALHAVGRYRAPIGHTHGDGDSNGYRGSDTDYEDQEAMATSGFVVNSGSDIFKRHKVK